MYNKRIISPSSRFISSYQYIICSGSNILSLGRWLCKKFGTRFQWWTSFSLFRFCITHIRSAYQRSRWRNRPRQYQSSWRKFQNSTRSSNTTRSYRGNRYFNRSSRNSLRRPLSGLIRRYRLFSNFSSRRNSRLNQCFCRCARKAPHCAFEL